MYVIPVEEESKDVIVIDPGEINEDKLYSYFLANKYNPIHVILTHEHFDHCGGVNLLTKYFDFKLITSFYTANAIKDSKKNLSRYALEHCPEFIIDKKAEVIHDLQQIQIEDLLLTFIETTGHSRGSICIKINDNYLFSGDTILESKTPLNLPGANKNDWENSIHKLRKHFDNSTLICPGHGNIYYNRIEK